MRTKLAFASVIGLTLALSSLGYGARPEYRIVPIGTLGGPMSWPQAINNAGQVVGVSSIADGTEHAFIWDSTNGMRKLDAFDGPEGRAMDISENGLVVGYSESGGSYRALLFDTATGTRRNLEPLPGHDFSRAWGVNSLGQVVGTSGVTGASSLTYHAVIWEADGTIRDLGTGETRAVDENGDAVGFTYDEGLERAFYWSRATSTRQYMGIAHQAYALNGRGQAVGCGPDNMGFTWDSVRGYEPLNPFGGYGSSAIGINNSGQVAGSGAYPNVGPNHAFYWDRAGGVTDLGTLPGEACSVARGINEYGVIAGFSALNTASKERHGVIWVPVPEPCGTFVMIAGIGMLAGVAWRRRNCTKSVSS